VVWPQNHKTVFVCLASKSVVTVSSGLVSKPAVTLSSGLASKPTAAVFTGLAAKTVATVSSGLASKPAATIFASLASKPVVMVFGSLASKLATTVSSGLASKPAVDFLVEHQNQRGVGFPSLGLKTDSSGLVIWDSKSPRRFFGLGLKTKWVSVCRLRHKTDGGRSTWDTRRDLAACFTWKQVWLGFPSLGRRLAEPRRRVVHVPRSWRLHQKQVEDGQVDAMCRIGRCYPTFTVFNVLDPKGIVVI
jgi:hypothetical protein